MSAQTPLLLVQSARSQFSEPSAQNDGRSAEEELVGGSSSAGIVCTGPSHVGSASLGGALANLVLAVLGAGQLTLPYAMSELGLVFGLSALLLFTLLSVHSLHTLSIHELYFTPCATDCIESYAELVVRVLGPSGKALCSVLLALYAWGGALSFLVILKGELAYLALRAGVPGIPGYAVMISIAGCIIFPLSALEDLSGLKRLSPLGCAAALFITLIVLSCAQFSSDELLGVKSCAGPVSGHAGGQEGFGELQLWPHSMLSIAAALPLLSFALNSSWAYIPILCTMREKTMPRVAVLFAGANAIILVNYVLISLFGYVTFCEATQPNILESLGDSVQPTSPQGSLVLLARAALAVQLTLALPMRFFVARRTICPSGSPFVRFPISAGLVAAAAGLAALPLSLATVLGITSSICATMIIYILPAVVDLRVQLPGRMRKVVSVLGMLTGLFVLGAGLLANALGVAAGS